MSGGMKPWSKDAAKDQDLETIRELEKQVGLADAIIERLTADLTAAREQCKMLQKIVDKFNKDRAELLGSPGDMARCAACGVGLLFSARQIGDGLCHFCGHKSLAQMREQFAAAREALQAMYDCRWAADGMNATIIAIAKARKILEPHNEPEDRTGGTI